LLNEFWISTSGYTIANSVIFSLLFITNTGLLLYTKPYKEESSFLLPSRCLTNLSLIVLTTILAFPSSLSSNIASGFIVGLFILSIISLFIAYGKLLIKGATLEQSSIVKRRALLKNLLTYLNGTNDVEKTIRFLQINKIDNPEDLLEQAYIDKQNELSSAINTLEKISKNQVYFELSNPLLYPPKIEDNILNLSTKSSDYRQSITFRDRAIYTPQKVRSK
jgi:hypothetical protein